MSQPTPKDTPVKIVKVGLRGKHLAIPDGWELIKTGTVSWSDMFADLSSYKWTPMERDDEGQNVADYDFVIRRILPPTLI